MHLEIPLLAFQETDVYNMHGVCCIGTPDFGIKKVGMIGFGYRLEARRCMVR